MYGARYLPAPAPHSLVPTLPLDCQTAPLFVLSSVGFGQRGVVARAQASSLVYSHSLAYIAFVYESTSGTESGHNDAFDTLLLALRNRRDHHGVRPPSADAGADWMDAQCSDEIPQHQPVAREPLCMAYHPARPTAVDGGAMNIPGQSSSPPKVRARPAAPFSSCGWEGHSDSTGICDERLGAEGSGGVVAVVLRHVSS